MDIELKYHLNQILRASNVFLLVLHPISHTYQALLLYQSELDDRRQLNRYNSPDLPDNPSQPAEKPILGSNPGLQVPRRHPAIPLIISWYGSRVLTQAPGTDMCSAGFTGSVQSIYQECSKSEIENF